ncbi:MAG: hypothetical protein KJ000_12460 [Pirellulaceae bacterium]|nr:hypothetical protein [Pirellulaceae bacterium]
MSVAGNPAQWDDLFEQDLIPAVLTLVIAAWGQIEKPAQDAREDDISKRLYLALVNGKDRNSHAFLIRYQDVEVDDDLSKESGRKDIVFFPSLFDEPIYFCLEAKRLSAMVSGQRKSLADEYVKEGMQRFVERKYSRHVRHGGMLGYVLDGDIDRAIANVSNCIRLHQAALRMEGPAELLMSRLRLDDPQVRETRHFRKDESIVFCLHHLFVAGAV